jgi:hypothetical protein
MNVIALNRLPDVSMGNGYVIQILKEVLHRLLALFEIEIYGSHSSLLVRFRRLPLTLWHLAAHWMSAIAENVRVAWEYCYTQLRMHDPLQRLYRTKLALLATLLLVAGLALLFFARWLDTTHGWMLLRSWPIADVGSALFTTGLLGVALQYFDGQDSEVRATQRLERVIGAATPAMRDAVIDGFAFKPEDIARVTTPEVLDKIITNGLAIRLGDADFAEEIYDDLRQQAIGIPERLSNARTSIRLSLDRDTAKGRIPLFVTTIRWEFEVVPRYGTRRFICLSNLDEFRDLDQDTVATSAWYLRPQPGIDAAAKDSFELLDFTVDGQPRTIRRSSKQDSQTYSVNIGQEAMDAGKAVHVAYTYRTVLPIGGHRLLLRVDQPTKGLAVELDYSDTELSEVQVMDFISSSQKTRIGKSPESVPGKVVTLEFDGWVFPRSGVVFVWR